jgi:hypothetical protein
MQLQQNKSLSGSESDAYQGCMDDYDAASNSLAAIDNCIFENLDNLYRNGMTSLESCRDRMLVLWMDEIDKIDRNFSTK